MFKHIEEQYEKVLLKLYPPSVTIDNASDANATLIKVNSSNQHGILLEILQILIDLNLNINKAYISSDGQWFMDVFYVVDQYGHKIKNGSELVDQIQQTLKARECSLRLRRFIEDVQLLGEKLTFIELIGVDRPGLLSEIYSVLAKMKCNVVASMAWTHSSRLASIFYITDEVSGLLIENPIRLNKIKNVLQYVLELHHDKPGMAQTAVMITLDGTNIERRLHQMLYNDRDYDMMKNEGGQNKELDSPSMPMVTIEHYADRFYSVVNVQCKNRPKLLFDVVCTLTDMKYVIFHASITCGGSNGTEANQEYYIRHLDDTPVNFELEKIRIIQCLKAAIKRRGYEGIKLEIFGEDRVGLLSDTTRIFREYGLTVIEVEARTRGTQVVNVFYVADPSGNPLSSEIIGALRDDIKKRVLLTMKKSNDLKEKDHFSLRNMIRSSSEKFLYNLGLFKNSNVKTRMV